MKRKPPKKSQSGLWLDDQNLASMRLSAIQVAAHLPEDEPGTAGGMMSGYAPRRPGKTADKVVTDAEKIMAFITRK